MSKVIISKKGREFGPFTIEVTRSMFLTGRFLADDRARTVGAKNWVRLAQIPGLVEVPGGRAPKPTTPSRRRALTILALLATALATWVAAVLFWRGDVEGQVFVTTRDRLDYHLRNVTVSLYRLDALSEHLDNKSAEVHREFASLRQRIDQAAAELDRASKAEQEARAQSIRHPSDVQSDTLVDEAVSAHRIARDAYSELQKKSAPSLDGVCFFDQLPKPLASAQTDEDGRFSIRTPSRGEFAIVARARITPDSGKDHCWMIRVSLNGKSRKSIVLSNDNRIPADSPDSLVRGLK
jgi:hypothetical protein